jgi:hypothetical protein
MPTSNQRLRVSWCPGCVILALIVGPAVALSLPDERTPWSWLDCFTLAVVVGPPAIVAATAAALLLPLAADAWGHLGWSRWASLVMMSGAVAGGVVSASVTLLNLFQPSALFDMRSLLVTPLVGAAQGAVGGLCVAILCPGARRSPNAA